MTQWTQEQYQELSRKVAEKFTISEFAGGYDEYGVWLYEYWHTIMELCVKHGVSCIHSSTSVSIMNSWLNAENYQDHNNDPSLAERVARMLALLEI